MIIQNGSSVPLNQATGSLPQMSPVLQSWFQPMVFSVVTKEIIAGQVLETKVDVSFQGVIQPLSNQQLLIKPEGQRAWEWLMVHATPQLQLQPDDVITYNSRQYRVMARKDFAIYGYLYYELVADYTGAGPNAP